MGSALLWCFATELHHLTMIYPGDGIEWKVEKTGLKVKLQ